MSTARYYQQLEDGRVACGVCPHHCKIAAGKTGLCGSRRNLEGTLVSEVYGKPCALAIDPIEKKPLYHFHPGTTCLSLACTGCNFRCLNCQNHDISQAKPEEVPSYALQPEALIALCQKHRCPSATDTSCRSSPYHRSPQGSRGSSVRSTHLHRAWRGWSAARVQDVRHSPAGRCRR